MLNKLKENLLQNIYYYFYFSWGFYFFSAGTFSCKFNRYKILMNSSNM